MWYISTKKKTLTFARVRATLILCQSPSNVEAELFGFSFDLTNDTRMQSLSLPCNTEDGKSAVLASSIESIDTINI